MQSLRKRVYQVVPLLLLALAVIVQAKPAVAQEYHCFEDLGRCYERAATRDAWISMWLAGLDCELTLVHCVERAIVY
jgi:hypothetical protein